MALWNLIRTDLPSRAAKCLGFAFLKTRSLNWFVANADRSHHASSSPAEGEEGVRMLTGAGEGGVLNHARYQANVIDLQVFWLPKGGP